MIVRLGLAQIHIIHGNVNANLERATSIMKSAASLGCSLVVFPELFSSGFDLDNAQIHALRNSEFLFSLKSLQETAPIILGGSLIEAGSGKRYFNTFYFVPPGSTVIKYRKVHLFKPMREHEFFIPGNQLVSADLLGEQVGLSICYDLRFPMLFQKYAQQGCKLVILSAEFPLGRIEHWKVLTRARAVENQIYIAAVNCVGKTGDTLFGGSSIVVSPTGNTLVEGSTHEEALLFVDIDLDAASKYQLSFPVLPDSRPDVYSKPVKLSPTR